MYFFPICTSYARTKLLVLEGLGIARIPLYLVEKELEEESLIQFCSEYTIATHPLYLVYLTSKYRSRKHERVRDLILSWLKKHSSAFY